MTSLRPALLALIPAAAALAAPSAASSATAFYAVTADNQLVELQSDNVKQTPARPLRGLAAGEKLRGIDYDEKSGLLYGLTNSSRLVVVQPRTAQIIYVNTAFSPALTGTRAAMAIGEDIRVQTDAGQNLRLDRATGQLVRRKIEPAPTTPGAETTAPGVPDANLAYVPGDPGFGTPPRVTASAYSHGATPTLFALDAARKTLVRQFPENSGTLGTVGALISNSAAIGDPIALDIIGTSGGDRAWAAIQTRPGASTVGLYSVNLATGQAQAASAGLEIGTTSPVVGLTAVGAIADDTSRPRLSVSCSSTQLRSRLLDGGVQLTASVNEAISGTASVKYKNKTVGTAQVEVGQEAGYDRVAVPLDSTTRNAIRRGSALLKLRVEVTDGAGNRSVITRSIRTR